MSLLIYVVAILIVAGLIDYVVQRATFVAEPYKGTARWVILIAVVIILISVLWPYVPKPGRGP